MDSTTNQFTGKTNTWITSLSKALEEAGLSSGRMMSMSKSKYEPPNKDDKYYFNACIYDSAGVQVWYGDINITESMKTLKAVAKKTNQPFYITPEHPYRSDFHKIKIKDLEKDKEWVVKIEP